MTPPNESFAARPAAPRILIAAGGTAGHIIPALTVADAIKKRVPGAVIEFVGAGKDLERQVIEPRGYRLHAVQFAPVLGKGPTALLKVVKALPAAWGSMRVIARTLRPNVVLGFGGYPSVVPLLYARFAGIHSILHESNASVGLANKMLACVATRLLAAHGAKGFPSWRTVEYIGNPIREDFFGIPAWKAPGPGEKFTIAVFGGSQGAVRVNSAVLAQADLLRERDVAVFHQAGAQDFERVSAKYAELGLSATAVPFTHEVLQAYRNAHLIVCRAGALTVAEVSASGRPAIFVPLDAGAAHQRDNIRFLLQNDAAFHLPQNEELPDRLRDVLTRLLVPPYTELAGTAERCRKASMTGGVTATEALVSAALAPCLAAG